MSMWKGCAYKLCYEVMSEVVYDIRPYLIDLVTHFIIFYLTIVALFLTQVVFLLILILCNAIFKETPYFITMLFYISDALSTFYFICYLNKDLLGLLNGMKSSRRRIHRSWGCRR